MNAIGNATKFYIDGQWVEPASPRRLEVINPATERPIAAISLGDAADIDRAVAAARKAFPRYSETSREERVALLERILVLYKKRWHEIAQCISAEVGAPIKLAGTASLLVSLPNLSVRGKVGQFAGGA